MEGGHLAGDGGRDAIVLAVGQQAWTVRPSPREIVVEDGTRDNPRVLIGGPPGAVLRWLWGRASDDEIRLDGDPAWADYLRRLLAVVTQ
jgi:hypothetical protein